jgi:RNA polymerase II elongation factor ELL
MYNRTKYIKDGSLPAPGRRGPSNKSKFLSQNRLSSDTTRSMPSSPALSGVGSPSLGPTSVPLSQQQAEQAKAVRKPVIHLLAVESLTEEEIREKIDDQVVGHLKEALLKVSDLDERTRKWSLRKNFFKELDVWTFAYATGEDRQRAIDNAVRTYDKMRLGVSEPEWEKLLKKSERGTGKCLSKLQAQIAAGPVSRGPKINVQKADDSGRDTPNREDDVFTDKKVSKVKGESLPRSVSQPPTTKSKKVSEKESQAKRLLSKNPAKSATKSAPAKKAPPPKVATKVLSSEFVNDSDEEDDYPVPTKPAPKPMKRSRDEDLDTSDSSIPLSKRVRKDTPTTHRVSDASQSSRTTTSSHYSSSTSKVKGNSPQKSSPLASSPPTNASDMESTSGERTSSSESPARHLSTKDSRSPIHKRHQKSSSVSSSGSSRCLKPEVTDMARRFKMFYPKYKALHQELASMGEHRDKQKEKDLFDMHARLAQMKKEIEAGIIDVDQRSD